MTTDFVVLLTQALAYASNLIAVFATLAGVAALVSVLVDLAKRLGLKDGDAPKVALALNGVFFVLLAALGLFAHVTPEQFDQFVAAVATVLTVILGFVTQVILSPKIHDSLRDARVPLIVKSYSGPKS